ncbi:MAG: AMP-binding protein [Lachnospiraceae bacterium]|jgi:long-chain acyl-CoA synthetase|nr:AMP-binding protein [Lachnospiraceae bacterium]
MNELRSTIYELLVKAEEAYGTQDAIRYKVKSAGESGKKETKVEARTYTQLRQDSERFSAALSGLGEQGKHIALVGATSYSWITAYYGIVNGGSVAVPLDANLSDEDLCELIDRADVTTLIYDGSKESTAVMAAEKCPKLVHIIAMEAAGSGNPDILPMWDLIGKEQKGTGYEPKPEDLATIMFTSGTTGKSKGVMLTHRNLAENATALDMGYEPGMVVMSVLPIHHAYCLSMDILKGTSIGAIICINDSLLRVAKNIKLFEPNMILMVPLMVETLAKKMEEASFIPAPLVKGKVFGKQFHTICSGGAYLNPAYIDFFKKYGITILQGYGMTECAPVISTNCNGAFKAGSIGKCMPNCEVKIVDEELWVKGSSVMQGYYKMPEETAQTLEDGWLKTGDLGYIDEEGYLFLTGRKKNLIITPNGENVSPEEIENKLSEKRLVQEVLVRESDSVIEAEIFPDYEYAAKKKIKDIQAKLQEIIDSYNKTAPLYKRIFKLKVRDVEFEKNTTKKIKRF